MIKLITKIFPYFFFVTLLFACNSQHQAENNNQQNKQGLDWAVYQGDDERNQYSPLEQITPSNVNKLEVAWEYSSGDAEKHTQIQCNPIIINGIMYASSPKLKVFALNAETGKLLWEFNPNSDINFSMNVNRGVVYWEDGDDKRILFTAGSMLFALNAEDGKPVESFGAKGVISIKQGLGKEADDLYVVATTPGVTYQNLLILGSRVSENYNAASGFIQAFDIKTGSLVWVFHTIPQPGEPFYDTWEENAYQYNGGANSWSGMSIDREAGIVYAPTGSASGDFWGGKRKGQNLFANCVLALDASTGKRIWHYQTVHHDLWDRDLPAPPNLVTVTHKGRKIKALAQITKSALVFLLNRETGEPLFPVEEKAVVTTTLDDDKAWPTQPIPTKPKAFARQNFTLDEVTNISPEANQYVREKLKNMKFGGQFIPPGLEGTIIFPGLDGGGEWGGAAVDPHSGIMYVNASEMPWILKMNANEQTTPTHKTVTLAEVGHTIYQSNCAVCHGQERQGDPSGAYPSLQNIADKLDNTSILKIINQGKGFMPGFGHISTEKKEALIAFLLGLEEEVVDPHTIGLDKSFVDVPYTFDGYKRFLDQDGYPAVKPPWGTLSAIDLNNGEIKWQVLLGEFEELTKKGIPQTGTENYGGPVVTAGGLIFIGASRDGYFRAFDKESGNELWKYKLPTAAFATPSIYSIKGKQYIVIACGGGKLGVRSDDKYIAFALPD